MTAISVGKRSKMRIRIIPLLFAIDIDDSCNRTILRNSEPVVRLLLIQYYKHFRHFRSLLLLHSNT